jgi:HicA toxin of bacterial toxin-antitoxin,
VSPRQPVVSGERLIKALRKEGWEVVRQRGSHVRLKRLKTTLKAEIDQGTWATLNATQSRPFPLLESGKIAVKVINDYGDEVMKVFEVEAS